MFCDCPFILGKVEKVMHQNWQAWLVRLTVPFICPPESRSFQGKSSCSDAAFAIWGSVGILQLSFGKRRQSNYWLWWAIATCHLDIKTAIGWKIQALCLQLVCWKALSPICFSLRRGPPLSLSTSFGAWQASAWQLAFSVGVRFRPQFKITPFH